VAKTDLNSRILVVDDEELIRSLLTDLLTREGHLVEAAESASEAIRLLLKKRYSLLIADHLTPNGSGIELAHEVRGRGLRLPILVLSSQFDATQEALILNLGLADFLPNPFSIDQVRDAVARLLSAAENEESDTPKPSRYVPD